MDLRIAVIGTGVIGGSILLRLRDKGFDAVGWDPDVATAQRASAMRLPFAAGLDEALRGRDLVFLAGPLASLPASLVEVAKRTGQGCVLTDVGSAKQGIAEHAARHGAGHRFVPGHPLVHLAGVGLWGASPSLLEASAWALCPSGETLEGFRCVAGLLAEAFRARVIPVRPSLHDIVVTVASEAPRVPATVEKAGGLTRARLRAAVLGLAMGGSHGAVRVSGTPGQWAADLMSENRQALKSRLGMVREILDELVAAVDDEERAARLLTEARLVRRELEERSLVAREARFKVDDHDAELEFLIGLGASGGYLTRCEVGVSGVAYTALHTPGG